MVDDEITNGNDGNDKDDDEADDDDQHDDEEMALRETERRKLREDSTPDE